MSLLDMIDDMLSADSGGRRQLPKELSVMQSRHTLEQVQFAFTPTHDDDKDAAAVYAWMDAVQGFMQYMVADTQGSPPCVDAMEPYMKGLNETIHNLHSIGLTRIMATGRQLAWEKFIAEQKAEWNAAVDEYERKRAARVTAPPSEALH
jgi:hypothetical protein